MRALVVLIAATAACTSLSGAADLTLAPAGADLSNASLADAGTMNADGSNPGDPSRVPPGADAGAGAGAEAGAEAGIDAGPGSGPFDFVDVDQADLDVDVKTSAIVAGFAGTLAATISGPDAQLRMGSGPWRTTTAVTAGDKLEIRLTTSAIVSTATKATVTIGSIVVDWVVTTAAACPPQAVTWSVVASTCTTLSGAALNPGQSRALKDSIVPTTGKVTITCSKGVLVPSSPVCEPLRVFDVSGPTGCVNGTCLATLTPFPACAGDLALASEICVFKGYGAATTFTTTTTPPVPVACRADGTGCVAVDPAGSCPIVFASVTCRY